MTIDSRNGGVVKGAAMSGSGQGGYGTGSGSSADYGYGSDPFGAAPASIPSTAGPYAGAPQAPFGSSPAHGSGPSYGSVPSYGSAPSYGAVQSYGPSYGPSPDGYGQPVPYTQTDPYAQPNAYGQPNPYGQYGAPQTVDPYAGAYPGPVVYSRPTNTMAILSLVFSLVGLLTYGFTGIVGVILGHVARSQVKRTGEQGAGLALAGLIVGYALIGLFAAGIALYVVAIGFAVASGV